MLEERRERLVLIATRVEPEIRDRIDALAEKLGLQRSQLLRLIIVAAVEDETIAELVRKRLGGKEE